MKEKVFILVSYNILLITSNKREAPKKENTSHLLPVSLHLH